MFGTHREFLESIGLTSSDSAARHTSYQRQFIDNAAATVTPSLGDVSKVIERWFDFIEKSLIDDMLSPDELAEARKLVESSKASVNAMNTISKKLDDQSTEAEKKYKDQLPPDKRLALSEKEVELANLEEEISRVRQEFNPNNLYSVIPLLVVRGGAVLMLLFLTQILLAAYRYTNMLSTHYSAVADSLCLTHQAFPGSGPDNDQFIKLLQALNPKDLSYIPPKAPTDQFVTLATQIK